METPISYIKGQELFCNHYFKGYELLKYIKESRNNYLRLALYKSTRAEIYNVKWGFHGSVLDYPPWDFIAYKVGGKESDLIKPIWDDLLERKLLTNNAEYTGCISGRFSGIRDEESALKIYSILDELFGQPMLNAEKIDAEYRGEMFMYSGSYVDEICSKDNFDDISKMVKKNADLKREVA